MQIETTPSNAIVTGSALRQTDKQASRFTGEPKTYNVRFTSVCS